MDNKFKGFSNKQKQGLYNKSANYTGSYHNNKLVHNDYCNLAVELQTDLLIALSCCSLERFDHWGLSPSDINYYNPCSFIFLFGTYFCSNVKLPKVLVNGRFFECQMRGALQGMSVSDPKQRKLQSLYDKWKWINNFEILAFLQEKMSDADHNQNKYNLHGQFPSDIPVICGEILSVFRKTHKSGAVIRFVVGQGRHSYLKCNQYNQPTPLQVAVEAWAAKTKCLKKIHSNEDGVLCFRFC